MRHCHNLSYSIGTASSKGLSMRDDLHRTPALLRVWQGTVRHASRPADDDRVAYDMSRAAKLQMDAGQRPEFVNGLREALGGNHGQLFPESRLDALRAVEQHAKHPLEQRLVEVARAICLKKPGTADVMSLAQATVFREVVDNGVEHVTAVVRTKWGAGQSMPLRMNMNKHRAECTIELGSKRRPGKMAVEALLNLTIPAQ